MVGAEIERGNHPPQTSIQETNKTWLAFVCLARISFQAFDASITRKSRQHQRAPTGTHQWIAEDMVFKQRWSDRWLGPQR